MGNLHCPAALTAENPGCRYGQTFGPERGPLVRSRSWWLGFAEVGEAVQEAFWVRNRRVGRHHWPHKAGRQAGNPGVDSGVGSGTCGSTSRPRPTTARGRHLNFFYSFEPCSGHAPTQIRREPATLYICTYSANDCRTAHDAAGVRIREQSPDNVPQPSAETRRRSRS